MKLYHLFRFKYLVKTLCGQESQGYAGILQGNIFLVSLFGGLGCVLVSDVWIQAGNQHQGPVQVVIHLFLVGADAACAVVVEGGQGVG